MFCFQIEYEYLKCTDYDMNCPNLSCSYYKSQCPKKCGVCSSFPLKCENSSSYCLNEVNSEFGFRCLCSLGFKGDLCERRDPCGSSPCQNGGVCIKFGSNGYTCKCSDRCSGDDCSKCIHIEDSRLDSTNISDPLDLNATITATTTTTSTSTKESTTSTKTTTRGFFLFG